MGYCGKIVNGVVKDLTMAWGVRDGIFFAAIKLLILNCDVFMILCDVHLHFRLGGGSEHLSKDIVIVFLYYNKYERIHV